MEGSDHHSWVDSDNDEVSDSVSREVLNTNNRRKTEPASEQNSGLQLASLPFLAISLSSVDSDASNKPGRAKTAGDKIAADQVDERVAGEKGLGVKAVASTTGPSDGSADKANVSADKADGSGSANVSTDTASVLVGVTLVETAAPENKESEPAFTEIAAENLSADDDDKTADDQKAADDKASDLKASGEKPSEPSDATAETIKEAGRLLQGKEGSLKLLESIDRDLTEGKGGLYGNALERVRNNLRELMTREPNMSQILEPLARKIQIPAITGRSEAIQKRLESADPEVRSKEVRSEISRLLQTSNKTPSDYVELDRLRKTFLQEMKGTKSAWDAVVKDLDKIYDKEMEKIPLSQADKDEIKRLEEISSKLRTQSDDQMKFLVKMLNSEADATAFLSSRGGKATEGIVFDAVKERLEFLQKHHHYTNFEVVKLSGGAIDDLGGDFLLLDKKSGNYILIDSTQESADGERKADLPAMRKAGLISSDPHQWEGRANARKVDIQNQADVIFETLKTGRLTQNIYSVDIAVARHQTSVLNYKQRMEYIESQKDPMTRAVEIRGFREELLEKQRGLSETIEMCRQRKIDLLAEKRGAGREQRDLIDLKRGVLDGLIEHTEKKPLVAIRKRLEELDRLTKALPPAAQNEAAERFRPGSAYNVSKEGTPVRDFMDSVRQAKSILGSEKPVSPAELGKALETLIVVHGDQSAEADILRGLKSRLEAANRPAGDSNGSTGTARDGAKEPGQSSPEKLGVPKELLSERALQQFHQKVESMSATLKGAPIDSDTRIADAVSEFLKESGIKEPQLTQDKISVDVSKTANQVGVEYSAKGKAALRVNGKFVLASDGKTELAVSEVETKFVVPEKLLKGQPEELTKALYTSMLEQTVRSNSATAAGAKAALGEFVSQSFARAVPTKADASTESTQRSSGAGAELTHLPESGPKVASLEISPNGVKIGNVDREIPFSELWTERIKGLEAKLSAEELKREKDQRLIAELKLAIAEEREFHAKLSNDKSPGHAEAMKRAQEIMHSFKPSAAEIEKLASEHGPGGAVRGRLVAVATLLNAFIALKAAGK